MEEIKSMYMSLNNEKTNNSAFVHSNGSSGHECGYYIGPEGFNLIQKVESFQRGSKIERMLKISTSYPERKKFNEIIKKEHISIDFSSNYCIQFLSKFLEKNPRKTHIEVTPNILMMMNCHDELFKLLKNKFIRVITTGDDAYKTDAFPSFDRMIDWKTGCNFHECRNGSTHILPIWFEEGGMSYNILNLEKSNISPVADLLEFGEFSNCSCGRKKCQIKLVSHFKHKPKSDNGYFDHSLIFKNLKGKYLNFQIIFKGKVAQILVDEFKSDCSRGGKSEEDYELAKKTLSPLGFRTTLEKGKYAYLGRRKRPLLWVDDGRIVIEQF
jgi:hypothetical protein